MAEFDVIVASGGTGNNIAAVASDTGRKTALVEPGSSGGPCLNRGCTPSKTLVQAANAVNHVREAKQLHADTSLDEVDYSAVEATEAELQDDGRGSAVGRADYSDSAMGQAKKLEHGFVKVRAAPDGEIMNSQAIRYEASALLHESVLSMRHELAVDDVAGTIHAHPTLSKVLEAAFQEVTRQ